MSILELLSLGFMLSSHTQRLDSSSPYCQSASGIANDDINLSLAYSTISNGDDEGTKKNSAGQNTRISSIKWHQGFNRGD